MFLDGPDDELNPGSCRRRSSKRGARAWRKAQFFSSRLIDEQGNPIGARVPPFTGFVPNGELSSDRIARLRRISFVGRRAAMRNARAALERLMPLDPATWFCPRRRSPLVFLTPFFGDVVSICAPLGRYRIHEDKRLAPQGRHLEALHRRLSAVFFVPETICAVAKGPKGIELDPEVLGSTSRRNQVCEWRRLRPIRRLTPIAGRYARSVIAERIEGVDSRA